MKSWFEHVRRKPCFPRPIRPLAGYRYVRLRWRMLFSLVDAIGYFLVAMLEARKHAARMPEVRSILIVQLDHLGDAILSIGLLRGLKARWPQARIDVLASAANAELFACLPSVDRVFLAHTTRFSSRIGWVFATLRWGWRLRRYRYDLGIDPRGDFPSAVILRLSGAPARLGWGSGGGGFLLTHRAEFVWGRHEVLSRQALLNQLGVAPPANEPAWSPQWTPSPAARHAMHRKFPRATSRVVLHIGAGTWAKRWPTSHWEELVYRLIVQLDPQIVLIGSTGEGQQIDVFPGVLNLCGELSIESLAALLQEADVFVGGDSGPAHLAAAVGTPAVVLFSGTNLVEQWRPWGDRVQVLKHETACSPCHRRQCPLADHPCLTELRPAAVAAAIVSMLSVRESHDATRLERSTA